MSNISYCRFQNTIEDFRDCVEALQSEINSLDSLSPEEQRAERIKHLCNEYIEAYDGFIN